MANSTKEIFRQNLKYYRNKLNLTQEQLSERSDISSDYLSEIERNTKLKKAQKINFLCFLVIYIKLIL